MSFEPLGLRPELLRAIAAQGYTTPTPIQTQAIPAIFEGCDLLAGAQTGTGKTAAFALPIVQRLSEKIPPEKRRRPRALILVPTRELAAQVNEKMQHYGRRLSLRSMKLYGGVNIQAQIERLHRGTDIIVATPGRLLDHADRETADLSRIQFLVLDEADRMLDLGFIDDILMVASYLPEKRQTLLFSATYSKSIKKLADELLHQPRRIEVERRHITADAVTQALYPVERGRKREMLSHLIRKGDWKQVLVFVRTRYGADKLTTELLDNGLTAAAIHSNKSQSLRTRTLAEFKRGAVRVLVATDVAARGLDIERLPYVVNYDLPQVPEDYVHRIGRTGRAGEEGVAVSFFSPEEQLLLQAIEKLLKYAIPRQTIAEFQQVAVKRGGKAKAAKAGKGQSQAKKKVAKPAAASAKPGKFGKFDKDSAPAFPRSGKFGKFDKDPAPSPARSGKFGKFGKDAAQAATKPKPSRRGKTEEAPAAPKTGRRGQRSKG